MWRFPIPVRARVLLPAKKMTWPQTESIRLSARGGMRFPSNQALGRNDNFDECTGIRIGQSQFPTKLFGALSHPCQTNAQTSDSHLRNLRTDSLAIVTDRHHHLIFLLPQRNQSLSCSRMPEDVGEGFLNDAEDSSFQTGREPWEISRLYFE
jgi:hypothetical protein